MNRRDWLKNKQRPRVKKKRVPKKKIARDKFSDWAEAAEDNINNSEYNRTRVFDFGEPARNPRPTRETRRPSPRSIGEIYQDYTRQRQRDIEEGTSRSEEILNNFINRVEELGLTYGGDIHEGQRNARARRNNQS